MKLRTLIDQTNKVASAYNKSTSNRIDCVIVVQPHSGELIYFERSLNMSEAFEVLRYVERKTVDNKVKDFRMNPLPEHKAHFHQGNNVVLNALSKLRGAEDQGD